MARFLAMGMLIFLPACAGERPPHFFGEPPTFETPDRVGAVVGGTATARPASARSRYLVIGPDGEPYRRVGSTTIGPDGTTYVRAGNTTLGSDGTSYRSFGNVTVGSDGTVCRRSASPGLC
ncbi:MAG: hypothetical protein AAGK37_14305 [Pseudomonadota bacterium]